jgi:hypothetical protein
MGREMQYTEKIFKRKQINRSQFMRQKTGRTDKYDEADFFF